MLTLTLSVIGLGLGVFAGIWYHRQGRPVWRSLGITVDRRTPLDVVAGLVFPFAAISLVFLVEWSLGAIEVSAAGLSPAGFFAALGEIAGFAAFEEFVFRVLMLSGLVILFRRFAAGRWLAVGLTALVFGAAHLTNEHATLLTAFGTGLGGVIYGVAFLATRSFWLPLALHISWNLSQALWGFPVSGNTSWPGWVATEAVGDELLSGGAYGPEAGIPGMVSRLLILVLVVLYVKLRWSNGSVATLVFAPDPVKRSRG